MADQANGGLGQLSTSARCFPTGMPHMMKKFGTQEYVITPETTYILLSVPAHARRIFTDGRDWPGKSAAEAYGGYSIGRWIDKDGDGTYDVLESEKRGISRVRAPSTQAGCRWPSTINRSSRSGSLIDKTNSDIMHILTTVIDHALTRPWIVDKKYVRKHRSASRLDRAHLRREQRTDQNRQRALLPQRRRPADADAQGSAPA